MIWIRAFDIAYLKIVATELHCHAMGIWPQHLTFVKSYSMPGHVLFLTHWNHTIARFKDEETQVQRGKLTTSKSQSY